MVIWTVSDVIGLIMAGLVILFFMGLGMLYFVAFMIAKFSNWREKIWGRRHDQN